MLTFLWTMSLPREMKQLHRHNVLPFQYNATRIPQSIHHYPWYLCTVLSCRAGCQQWLKRNPYGSMFGRQSKTNFHCVYYEGIKPLRGKSPEELLNETLSMKTVSRDPRGKWSDYLSLTISLHEIRVHRVGQDITVEQFLSPGATLPTSRSLIMKAFFFTDFLIACFYSQNK